jgi:hypothetical protein
LAQRSSQADDGTARSVVEVMADELGPEPQVGDDDGRGDEDHEHLAAAQKSCT